MEPTNERFVKLRKACGKNQSEFAKILGLSRSGVTAIETGQRKVTDKHIIMLSNWTERPINTDWLITGEGEMFLSKSRNQTITDFAGDLIKEEDESFKKRLIEALAQLDEDDWEVLERIAIKITKEKG